MAAPAGTHRSPALVSREEAHRRMLLLGIGSLLLLSVSPVFGHHFAEGLGHGLRGQDQLGVLCLIALHEILQPVHVLFHVLVVAGLGYALYDRTRAALRLRRTLGLLEAHEPAAGDAFWKAATAAGLAPERVRVVHGMPLPAFTAGWLRPRVYVSAGVAERLSADELEALLATRAPTSSGATPCRSTRRRTRRTTAATRASRRSTTCSAAWTPREVTRSARTPPRSDPDRTTPRRSTSYNIRTP